MYPQPRELSTAAEVRANRRAVAQRLKSLPAWVPPEPEHQIILTEPQPAPAPETPSPAAPSPEPDPLAFVWRPAPGPRIRNMVAKYYGLTLTEIVAESRLQRYVRPRHVAMYLCVKIARMSTPTTGRLFHRDHSTVSLGARRLVDKMRRDPQLAADVAAFVQQIESWS